MDISVIIPTYHPGDYLWQCLDSLRKQTLEKSCYELIIILNGCDEPYRSSIKSYLKQWEGELHATLVQTDQGGVSNARNIGIERSSGQYIAFVDDDDWVSESYLENLLAKATSDSIMVANVLNYDETTDKFVDDYLSRAYKRVEGLEQTTLLSARSFFSCCHCKMIARKVIAEQRFNTHFSQSEDALFMAAISKNVKVIAIASPDTIYYRRTRSNSVRHKRPLLKVATDIFRLSTAFASVYFSDIHHYQLGFFLTRILGLVKNVFREIKER